MGKLLACFVALAAILAASSAAAQTPPPDLVCKPAKTVAVSVYGLWMGSGGTGGANGDPSIVVYDTLVTDVGSAWDTLNKNKVTASCTGTYALDVSFVKDSITTGTNCGAVGTFDDVYVTLWKQPVGGGSPVRIGNQFGAWAGEAAAPVYRPAASYHVAAHLDQGDAVFTQVSSDGGPFRCLASANFTVYKIGGQ
jgi:hypothetical protein